MGRFIFGFVNGLIAVSVCKHMYNKGKADQLKEIKNDLKNMKVEHNTIHIFGKEKESKA